MGIAWKTTVMDRYGYDNGGNGRLVLLSSSFISFPEGVFIERKRGRNRRDK